MAVRDLIPWGRSRASVPSTMREGDEVSPFLTLHREMNRLFDDVFNRFEGGVPSLFGRGASWPSIEVNATDKELRVSAELPGLDEDKDRHFSERYYGRFERSIALPFEFEDDKAEASFKNGVLTVSLPKSAKAQEKARRIAVNGATNTKH
jgi:HSP20 family protein